jgi:hypothetical protein
VIDEFYIGYEPKMPEGLVRRIRPVAFGVVALALIIPSTLVFSQERFAPGVFEFGRVRSVTGEIIEFPYPALRSTDDTGTTTIYWLVGPGKHGAAEAVRGRDGQRVRLSGTLIQRDRDAMIEVVPDSLIVTSRRAGAIEPLQSRGVVTIVGEIVDSKCYLGVMKPGEGPTHRDCAVRCLLGQIPPMFVPHNRPDVGRMPLLGDAAHPFADADLYAGRRVSIRGEVLERGKQRFLAVVRRDVRFLD